MDMPVEESQDSFPSAHDVPASREQALVLRQPGDVDAVEILDQLRRYGEYEIRLRNEVSRNLGLGDRDVQALRYLTTAHAAGRIVRQKDLSTRLSITGASVSALVDRLVRHDYVERIPHPGDRRSVAVLPTAKAMESVRRTYEQTHRKVFAVVRQLPPERRHLFVSMLRRVNEATRQAPGALA